MSWLGLRGAGNRGAATAALRGSPAQITATWSTGAEVSQVVEFERPHGDVAALIVAGSCLQAVGWHGTELWRDFHSSVTKVLHVAQTGSGPVGLVLSGERQVRLVDLTTGVAGWRFQAPDGTNLSGSGSTRLAPDGDGWIWLVAPSYAETITCFEVESAITVRERWTHDFAGRYDRGFGPVMVVDDILGTGADQLLISSRTGSRYDADDNTAGAPTERVVLGREDGHLYQAMLCLRDGRILAETAYRPDPGDYPCARPYGLLQITGGPDHRTALLVSCQVEEFYAATRIGAADRNGAVTMGRAWGEFVEKDWPTDEQELRPQTSSVVFDDSTAPLLVTGHFDGSAWTTVIRQAATGERMGAVPGHYFWGTLSTGSAVFAVLSAATTRQLAGDETLRSIRIDTTGSATAGSLRAGRALRPVTSSTDLLPPHLSFHAERRTLLPLTDPTGRTGILVTARDSRLCWWDPATDELRTIMNDVDVTAGFPGLAGAIQVVTRDGRVYRIGSDFTVFGPVNPVGRRPEAFVAAAGDTPRIFSHTSAGATLVRSGGIAQALPGRVAAVAESNGASYVTTMTDSQVMLFRCGTDAGQTDATLLCTITPNGKPQLASFVADPDRLVISERTGVHTAAIGAYTFDGSLVWRDDRRGPHPNLPLSAADQDGRWLVGYDDHGILVLRDGHTGELLAERDWTAAYTTPALARSGGQEWLLRLGGVHGVEAVSLDGTPLWRYTAPLWRHFPGEAAVADAGTGPVLGCASRDGTLDLIDAATGRLLRTVTLGPVAARPPLVAVDVDGDGHHEFVAGTTTGHLVTVRPDTGETRDWAVSFPAAVEYLAAADTTGAGYSDLLVGTADGNLTVVQA